MRAELAWRGECEDLPALLEEMQARDAELQQPAPQANILRVAVEVQRQELELVAELELTDPTGHERRSVVAPDCAALRRAVAWVLAGAGGLVDSIALGPALVVQYRPCARSWPGVSVGAVHLLNVDYSLDSRSISLRRTGAQFGAWVPAVEATPCPAFDRSAYSIAAR